MFIESYLCIFLVDLILSVSVETASEMTHSVSYQGLKSAQSFIVYLLAVDGFLRKEL